MGQQQERTEQEKEKEKEEQNTFSTSFRQKLVTFYQQHNPEQLNTVDEKVEKYADRQDELFSALKMKYGGGGDGMDDAANSHSHNNNHDNGDLEEEYDEEEEIIVEEEEEQEEQTDLEASLDETKTIL